MAIPSPCVKNCCLDSRDICLGCGRSLAEITGWRSMASEQREAVMARLSSDSTLDQSSVSAASSETRAILTTFS